MHRGQFAADIRRGPSGLLVQSRSACLFGGQEPVANVRRRQALQELLVGLTEPVKDVVPRGPQRVPAGGRQLDQPQTGVVGRARFELNVAVPGRRVVLAIARALARAVWVEFLGCHGRDGADLVVRDAELVVAIEHRVDMQRRRSWTSTEFAQPEDELLLQVIAEIVLFAKEHHAALADYGFQRADLVSLRDRKRPTGLPTTGARWYSLVIARSRSS